jgi:hypothetical protein
MPNWTDDFEIDADGRLIKKRKRIAADGENIHFTMQMMDAAAGFHRTFADGSVDHTHWSRPGFRFADVNDEARALADASYEAMRERLSNAWRHRGDAQRDVNDGAAPPRTKSLDEARAAAAAAYRDRCERMRNAWRNR